VPGIGIRDLNGVGPTRGVAGESGVAGIPAAGAVGVAGVLPGETAAAPGTRIFKLRNDTSSPLSRRMIGPTVFIPNPGPTRNTPVLTAADTAWESRGLPYS